MKTVAQVRMKAELQEGWYLNWMDQLVTSDFRNLSKTDRVNQRLPDAYHFQLKIFPFLATKCCAYRELTLRISILAKATSTIRRSNNQNYQICNELVRFEIKKEKKKTIAILRVHVASFCQFASFVLFSPQSSF